jgi:hypothetical protein
MVDSLYHAASAALFTGMLTRQGLQAAGMAAVDVPRALRLRGCQSISHVARRNARPQASARLDDPRCAAVNRPVPGCGHLAICRDARLICSLVSELISTETSADPARPERADRELMAA